MREKPFFSVIIPTLNEEFYLPRLLMSLGEQTYRNFEVIVVDGHSSDRTADKAKKLAGLVPKFTFVRSQKRNVSIQRNMGSKRATGEYLVFFDADVTLPRIFLSAIFRAIKEHQTLFLTTWMKPDSKKSQDELMASIGNFALEVAKAIDRPFAGGFNTIVAKAVFDKVGGFNPRLKISEDHDLAIRTHEMGFPLTILRRPRITFSFRRHRRYGYIPILGKYAQTSLYGLLKKPIMDTSSFEYPMGGHMYSKGKSEKLKMKNFISSN